MTALGRARDRAVAATERGRAALGVLRAPARRLAPPVRARLEPRLGYDFGNVRVHDDARAGDAARAAGAVAFAVGRDVVLGAGAGPRTLVHELVHVVQQRDATGPVTPAPSERGEAEADRAAGGDRVAIAHREPRPVVQRQRRETEDPMHEPLVEGFRREHALGPDAGPADASIKFEGLTAPPATRLGLLAGMTAYELAHASGSLLVDMTGHRPAPGHPGFEDYRRARDNVAALLGRLGYPDDPEVRRGPVGAVPDAVRQRVLDTGLQRILARPGVVGAVGGAGGRGVPRSAPGGPATLAGHVRIAPTVADFVVKQFQVSLSWLGAGTRLDDDVRARWPGVTGGAIVEQERKAALLAACFSMPPAAFFSPIDDVFYLPPGVDLRAAGIQDLARHETVHLLGSRERARATFVEEFHGAWLKYWSTFEEGTAELIAREASPTGASQQAETIVAGSRSGPTSVVVTAGAGYDAEVRTMRALTREVGREVVLRAYFSGEVPQAILDELRRRVP